MSISNNLRVVRLLKEARRHNAESLALVEQAREAAMSAESLIAIATAILEKSAG